ncbi:MAG: adenylate/guanylate cyclase domain-containing protein [Candidatus Aminicenantes bacterium]|nr:adenylate/guanylate cyclase domain-containing protein [Candidatus Aminicenantes bacterium]
MPKRLLRGLVIGLLAFTAAALVSRTGILESLEWKSWDARVRLLARPEKADPSLALFLIDQYSLDFYENQGLSWPWPRQMYSAAVDFLRAGGARAVFFDLILSEPSVYGEEDDLNLARAMSRAGNVFLPIFLGREDPDREDESGAVERSYALLSGRKWDRRKPPVRAVVPSVSASLCLDVLFDAARGVGNVRFEADGDGVFRRAPLLFGYRGLVLPALPLALAEHARGREIRLDDVPLDREGRMVINYHGPTGTYRAYPLASIINSWAVIEEGGEPRIKPSEFAGKIVLVGGSAPGLLDLRPTPLSPVSPGTEIQAAVVDNLLHDDFVRIVPSWMSLGLLLLFSLLTGTAVSSLQKTWHLVLFLALGLSLPAAAAAAAYRGGLWLDLAAPQLAVLAAFIGAALGNYRTEGRQRRFLKTVFKHYLSPQVIEGILEDPSRLRLGGERRTVSSFFSDVRGFTSISEKLSPEELVRLLNAYLSEMTDIILDLGGTLDKYEGDAVIAFWNAPLEQEDHALRACRAALRCQARLAELRPFFREKCGCDLAMRIGLNSGEAVVGNMGSRSRFDYTAMGDAINLAARLEGACKAYGLFLLAGEETVARAGDAVVSREADILRVVGRKRPVRVFELVGEEGAVSEETRGRLRTYRSALEAYRSRSFGEALEKFETLEGDSLAAVYAGRCRDFLAAPPPENWDGIFELKSK